MSFQNTLRKNDLQVRRKPLEVLQINVGKLCNQACLHCHVEAGPKRKEIMDGKTASRLLELIENAPPSLHTIDLTGGAPEMNPHFRQIVRVARAKGLEVIDRCNLTVLYEKGQEDTALFLQENQVHVIASLPCYSKANVEKQRGRGVFSKSIEALQWLNELGYARNNKLKLDLVYNPVGPSLPPAQQELEADYKKRLKEDFGIEFDNLYTITNMPIKRFLYDLERTGRLNEYMELLVNSFNAATAKNVMCTNLVSVAWDGQLYDCDFNQMLELPLGKGLKTVWDIESLSDFDQGEITFGKHCFACTAGAGSSCGGTLVN